MSSRGSGQAIEQRKEDNAAEWFAPWPEDTKPYSGEWPYWLPLGWRQGNWAVRWIRGRLEPNGGVGWFPQTYVKRIFEETESVLVEDSASGILVALDKTFLCL